MVPVPQLTGTVAWGGSVGPVPPASALFLESGSYLLLEDGSKLLLE